MLTIVFIVCITIFFFVCVICMVFIFINSIQNNQEITKNEKEVHNPTEEEEEHFHQMINEENTEESETTDSYVSSKEEDVFKTFFGMQVKHFNEIEFDCFWPNFATNGLVNTTAEERLRIATHESSHAIAALMNQVPLIKVTVISKAKYLGLTKFSNQYMCIYKEEYFKKKMIITLAGAAAEFVIFNERTTGAADDFKKANDLAYSMVLLYGMSPLGPVALLPGSCDFTKKQIDDAAKAIVDEGYANAKQLVTENRSLIEKFAKILLDKGKIEGDEINKLFSELAATEAKNKQKDAETKDSEAKAEMAKDEF